MGKIRYAGRERDKLREYLEIAFFLAGHKTPLKGYGFTVMPVLRPAIRQGRQGICLAVILNSNIIALNNNICQANNNKKVFFIDDT